MLLQVSVLTCPCRWNPTYPKWMPGLWTLFMSGEASIVCYLLVCPIHVTGLPWKISVCLTMILIPHPRLCVCVCVCVRACVCVCFACILCICVLVNSVLACMQKWLNVLMKVKCAKSHYSSNTACLLEAANRRFCESWGNRHTPDSVHSCIHICIYDVRYNISLLL